MTVRTETQSSVMMRRLALPSCPVCHDVLCAACASEFVSARQIRHQWSCDTCGHEFSTSVRLSFRSERAAALS
jgi:ribosomal protein L37AE/L43A